MTQIYYIHLELVFTNVMSGERSGLPMGKDCCKYMLVKSNYQGVVDATPYASGY